MQNQYYRYVLLQATDTFLAIIQQATMGNIFNVLCGNKDQVVETQKDNTQPKRQKLVNNEDETYSTSAEQKFVTNAVREARQDANHYSEKRSNCLQQSQEAYTNGDKAKAKQLSNEGKKWGKQMEDANARAARLILEPQDIFRTGCIDLHGLFVQEAIEASNDFLNYWSDKRKNRDYVVIITGAGHHSHKKGVPLIRPKIEDILRQRKLDYEPINGNGAFYIKLQLRQ